MKNHKNKLNTSEIMFSAYLRKICKYHNCKLEDMKIEKFPVSGGVNIYCKLDDSNYLAYVFSGNDGEFIAKMFPKPLQFVYTRHFGLMKLNLN